MVNVKGSTILLRHRYVTQYGTPDQKEAVLARLDSDFREQLDAGRLLPGGWQPQARLVQLTQTVDQILGTGDGALAWELGRYSAELGIKMFYGAFSKSGNPKRIFQIGTGVWKQFYSTGRLETIDEGRTRVRLQVLDFEEPAVEICNGVGGWIERNVELAGATAVKVEETKCRTRDHSWCEYDVRWS